jgi:U3 small nucleolar RNA-associated protein 23
VPPTASPPTPLVDGNFCHAALQYRLHIKEHLPKTLGAPCRELATRCVSDELRRLGADYSGAALIAKRFDVRQCGHTPPVPAATCIASLVGTAACAAAPRRGRGCVLM